MRKIKFRAWDEDAEYMFFSNKDEEDYFFEFKNGTLRGFATRPPRPCIAPMEPPEHYTDDYPALQFTGLHDKNGKEIYEADIVKTPVGNQKVYWNKYGWMPFLYCFQDWPKEFLEGRDCEVIGNVSENASLF